MLPPIAGEGEGEGEGTISTGLLVLLIPALPSPLSSSLSECSPLLAVGELQADAVVAPEEAKSAGETGGTGTLSRRRSVGTGSGDALPSTTLMTTNSVVAMSSAMVPGTTGAVCSSCCMRVCVCFR